MKIAVCLALLWSAAASAAGVLTFHPAHWVDGEDPEPTMYVSPLDALVFPSPDEGWIVGERYVLHIIKGERLEVAFVSLGESRTSVSFSNPALGWAGSPQQHPWPMLRYRSGSWNNEPLHGIGWPYWGISKVIAGPVGDAWAFAGFSEKVPGDLEFPKMRRAALRYDGERWTVDESLLADRPDWHPSDACQSPDGQWWFVGVDTSAPSGWGRVLARWDGRELQPVVGPGTDSERSGLYRIRCLADGTIWASGDLRPAKGQPLEILLMRYAGSWERVAVPDFFPREASASSLAPVSADEVWLSASCGASDPVCCTRFLHYRDGNWTTEAVPLMPGGRCRWVSIKDMQFVSPEEGWAVGDDDTPRLGIGRIFHYQNGQWRLRNWNWHFWDAPWFNLFG